MQSEHCTGLVLPPILYRPLCEPTPRPRTPRLKRRCRHGERLPRLTRAGARRRPLGEMARDAGSALRARLRPGSAGGGRLRARVTVDARAPGRVARCRAAVGGCTRLWPRRVRASSAGAASALVAGVAAFCASARLQQRQPSQAAPTTCGARILDLRVPYLVDRRRSEICGSAGVTPRPGAPADQTPTGSRTRAAATGRPGTATGSTKTDPALSPSAPSEPVTM